MQRYTELQSINTNLQKQLAQLRQQLTHMAEEKEAVAAAERKRLADRLKRRLERNQSFKVLPSHAPPSNDQGLHSCNLSPKSRYVHGHKIVDRHHAGFTFMLSQHLLTNDLQHHCITSTHG